MNENRKVTYLVIFLIIVGSLVLFISAQDKQGESVKLLLQQAKEWVMGQEQQTGLTEPSALVKKTEFLDGSVIKDEKDKELKIGEYSYTVDQVRKHLSIIFESDLTQMNNIPLWLPEVGDVIYVFGFSKDLGLPENEDVRTKFNNIMTYFKALTGVRFVEIKKDGNGSADILYTITSSFSMIKDTKFVRGMSKTPEMTESDYVDFWEEKEHYSSYYDFKYGVSPHNNKQFILATALASEKWNIHDVEYNIESVIGGLIYSTLLSRVNSKKSEYITETVLAKIYSQPPYIWPFDEALLKVMYNNLQLSQKPTSEAINVIINELIKEYGV